MPRNPKPILSFVTDTREQWPYLFHKPYKKSIFEDGGTLTYKLHEADYSAELDGELLPIRIERKEIGDFFGVVGKGRERFAGRRGDGLYETEPGKWVKSELERLRPYRSYLLIEATIEQVRAGCEHSLVYGEAAFASCWCWLARFGVIPIFAGNRRNGRDIAQRLLEEFAEHEILKK